METITFHVESIKSGHLDKIYQGLSSIQQLILNSLGKKTQISKELKFLKGFYKDLEFVFSTLNDLKVK
mgnify:FL=1